MALEYTETIRERSPFIKLLGVEVLKLENGTCQLALKIKNSFCNVHKNIHGGVIYSMADIGMVIAVYSTLKSCKEASN